MKKTPAVAGVFFCLFQLCDFSLINNQPCTGRDVIVNKACVVKGKADAAQRKVHSESVINNIYVLGILAAPFAVKNGVDHESGCRPENICCSGKLEILPSVVRRLLVAKCELSARSSGGRRTARKIPFALESLPLSLMAFVNN